MYYQLSMKNTQKRDKMITLWRPNDRGYTYFKEGAGIYTDETKTQSHTTICVKADDLRHQWKVGEGGNHYLPNKPALWNLLGVHLVNGVWERKQPL